MREISILTFFIICIAGAGSAPGRVPESGVWKAPFDTNAVADVSSSSILTLGDVLRLTAVHNPILKALASDRRASEAALKQASLWSNPELHFEIEEFALDAPGLQESELALSIAQEFELFGQRGARKNLARAEISATELETSIKAFDLYLEVKRRFYGLAHAQQQYRLFQSSVRFANEVVENIRFRMDRGAALQSELLLARLESQHSQLLLEQAEQEVAVAAVSLQACWGGESEHVTVTVESEPDFSIVLGQISSLVKNIDSTRSLTWLHRRSGIARAEQRLSAAEAGPRITLSGGIRRLEGSNTNSLYFGVSLPVPLFNRNQGDRERLTTEIRSIGYQIDGERTIITAELNAMSIRLHQLLNKRESLVSILIPTAGEVNETLKQIYESGRLPYTQLIEARRILYDLNSEHNNLLLAIQEQIIALESLSGVTLNIYGEN